MARLAVPLSEIRRIRQHPDWFIVQRGHENPEVERIVERAPQWSVVEHIRGRQLSKSSA
jgi:alpha-galactosidase